MFLFTPSVRTGGGTAKLASSPGIAPELPAGRWSEGAKGPGGQERGLWVHRDLGWAQGWALHKAGLAGVEGRDLPTGSMAGWPPELARWPPGCGSLCPGLTRSAPPSGVGHITLLGLRHCPRLGSWLGPRPLPEPEYISRTAGRQGQESVAGWEGLRESQAQLLAPEVPGSTAGW